MLGEGHLGPVQPAHHAVDGVAALRLVHRDLARAAAEGVPAVRDPVRERREHLAPTVGRPLGLVVAVEHGTPVEVHSRRPAPTCVTTAS